MKIYKGKITRIGNHTADGQSISVIEIGKEIIWRLSTHSKIMSFIDIGSYSELIVMKDVPFLNHNIITQLKTENGRTIRMPFGRLIAYVVVGVTFAGIIPVGILVLLSFIEPFWFPLITIPLFVIRLIRYFYASYIKKMH